LAGRFIEQPEDLVENLSASFRVRHTEKRFGHGVEVGDTTDGIGGHDAIADRLQGDLGEFLFLEKNIF
jgi:hypothetical protein